METTINNNYQLTLLFDSESCVIEVVNFSGFVISQRVIELPQVILASPEALIEILHSQPELQTSYKNVRLVTTSQVFAVVPEVFFTSGSELLHLQFQFEIPKNSLPYNAYIHSINAYNVYTVPKALCLALKTCYPGIPIDHHISYLLNHASTRETILNMQLWIASNRIDLVLFHESKLLIANSFSFNAETDIVYHVMNVLSKLNCKPGNCILSCYHTEIAPTLPTLIKPYVKSVQMPRQVLL